MEAIAIMFGAEVTESYARSAMPDAPVRPPTAPRLSRARPVRQATAAALYRLADLVEPRPA